ncbi:MAG: sigma-70 family RNA polymerase sigma factor [Actinomycetota bacterium]|nr:sigma-70 family RNA polymerase sigma factor [Actinomycetota bacterium]
MRAADDNLLEACRRGDARAWERLLDRYERLVFSIPLNYGLSRHDAADITQHTFTVLLQSLDDLHDHERLSSWLGTVARRHTWRLLERKRRERSLAEVGAVNGRAVVNVADPPDPIDDWLRLEWLHDGLAALGQTCRELLVAMFFDPAEPSYTDIAERLGRPVGSIGPTRARCLDKLRKALAPDV